MNIKIKDGVIFLLIIITSILTYNVMYIKNIETFNSDYSIGTTVKNVGVVPNKVDYTNALIPSKQAKFNNVNNWDKEWKVETITTYVNIFSKERDKILFPNSNFYSIPILPPIRNVYAIKIIRGCVPKGEYTVNENNNLFIITKGPTKFELELTKGDYDISTYVAMLNIHLLALNITAVFNALLSKINFITPDPDIIIFHLNDKYSPYTEIGFNNIPITWQNNVTSTNRVDLFGLQELEIKCLNLSGNNILDTILFKQGIDVIDFDYHKNITKYMEPHQEFYKLTLQFYNKKYQKLYNFNGLDNSLCIEFSSHRYVLPTLIPELKAT
jgi:hypothetical protein